MAKSIILTQNDYGILLRITVDFGDDTVTLTGTTVHAEIVSPDGTKYTPTVQPQITDAANRIVDYLISETDTAQVGLYTVYFYITTANSKLTAQKAITYYVQAEDGGAE